MQYYYLENSTERKVIGRKYPQCNPYPHELGFNWSYADLPDSMTKIPIDRFSDIKPLIVFELEKSIKLTDILSNATIRANGLLISERVKVLFEENLNIPNSKYYEAQIYFKGQQYKYYFLHILPYNLNIIDFDNSEFGLYEKILEYTYISSLHFNVSTELELFFKSQKTPFQRVRAKKINFKENMLDLYYFKELNAINEFISSEKVLQIIKEHKLTGFDITPIE